MSDLTSTNEESLIGLLARCPEDHYLLVAPDSDSFLSVFRIPNSQTTAFAYMTPEEKKQYWVCGFGAIAFHPEVWQGHPLLAMRYR